MLVAALAAVGTPLLGCGASNAGAENADGAGVAPPPGSGEPASEPEPPRAGDYRGTYFVPVPAELEPYALFEVQSVRVEVRGNELGLRYDLPELLLGEPRQLSFRGVASGVGEYRLEGNDGVAICRSSSGRWTCDEALNDIALDSDKVDRLLAPLPDAEARARRDVSDRFSTDPIGVLDVELSPRP